jgi:Mg2+ and Co2+ transporter CorA
MPGLDTHYGYAVALLLMAFSSIVPYVYFRRRGWL